MDTNGYGGSQLSKSTYVYTDDPASPRLTLTLSGAVTEFAAVVPKRIVLRGIAGQPIEGTATIIPKAAYPFNVTGATARDGTKIRFRYDKIQHPASDKYVLTVENLLTHRGRYADTIFLQTDNSVRPQIAIPVYGDIAGEVPAK